VEGFYGQYVVTMDNKGRLALPARLRPYPPDNDLSKVELMLTKGLDGCLALYPEDQWQIIQQRLSSQNYNRRNFRFYSRLLHSAAINVNLDKQGRLLIPSHLQEEAGLKGEILVIGVQRWIEIWQTQKYRDYIAKFTKEYGSYEDVAEGLLDLNRGEEN